MLTILNKLTIMDITHFDLQGLQSLHISFKNVLKDHEEQLDNLSKDEELYQLKFVNLIQRINNYKSFSALFSVFCGNSFYCILPLNSLIYAETLPN